MKLSLLRLAVLCGAVATTTLAARAADAPATPAALKPEDVLCKGKGVEIRQGELDKRIAQTEASAKATGRTIPPEQKPLMRQQLLDQLVTTKILLGKANDTDRKKGKEAADKFMADLPARAGGEAGLKKQLADSMTTLDEVRQSILDQATCGEVLEREMQTLIKVTDEDAKKFFEENPKQFEKPEMVRAAHILIATKDMATDKDLGDAEKKERRKKIDGILARAKKGEDFGKLAQEFSEDPGSKDRGGEYFFPRGQMVKEFEETAFSLKPGEISDVVTTQFGYHVIKLVEKVPAQKVELAKVQEDLKKTIRQNKFRNMQSEYFDRLKFDADISCK